MCKLYAVRDHSLSSYDMLFFGWIWIYTCLVFILYSLGGKGGYG